MSSSDSSDSSFFSSFFSSAEGEKKKTKPMISIYIFCTTDFQDTHFGVLSFHIIGISASMVHFIPFQQPYIKHWGDTITTTEGMRFTQWGLFDSRF